MSHHSNSQPIGWTIPGNSQTSPHSEFDDEVNTPDYYTSDSDSEQQLSTTTTFNNPDPFANLPDPIPVPYGKQSSLTQENVAAGGGGTYSGYASSSRPGGHHGYAEPSYNKPVSYGGSNSGSHYSKPSTNKNAKQSNSAYPQQIPKPSLVANPKHLEIFGKFAPLTVSDAKFKTIVKYVRNSHGLKESDGKVWVHNVYEISGSKWTSFINSVKHITGSPSGMMLWYKTTPGGIQRLAEGKNGCVAFYDRVCRAFPQNPRNLQGPLRHLIILCAVSLGNVHKDRNGFKHWSTIGRSPDGFNSVKGMGRLCPEWKENINDDSFEVPCGTTKSHNGYKSYEIEFNEYMVFKSKRIQVKYAVDLEISPVTSGARGHSNSESGAGRHKGKQSH